MRACGEEIEHGCECVRGERRGRLQGGADIPPMDGEFKKASVGHGVHRDKATRMIAGLVPLVGTEGGKKMREGVRGVAERRQQIVAKPRAESDGSLGERRRPLPPFLPREGLENVGRWETCRRRGIPPQSTGNAVSVPICYPAQMRHDITDVPEGTG